MSELSLIKVAGGVVAPCTPQDDEVLRSLPIGSLIQAKGSGRRNLAFHRRFFALLNLTFDYWEPTGGMVSPAEQKILTHFVRYLTQFGGGDALSKAKDEFIDLLASGRVELHGEQADKSFDVMRKWLTVEAGYFTLVVLPDGGMRKEAKSISFAKMEQSEFSTLYKAVFGVCWRHILSKGFDTEEAAEHAVAQLMGFAA